jgi:hypothetical protein
MRQLPLLLLTLACMAASVSAQRHAGSMRVLHESHPRPGGQTSLHFATNELTIDAFFYFAHDPTTGPLPRQALDDPIAHLGRFLGPLPSLQRWPGGVRFGFVPPALPQPLPFFALGVEARTLKFVLSPVETLMADVPFRRLTIDASNPPASHCKALGDVNGDGFVDALAASSEGGSGLFWYDARDGWRKHRIADGDFTVDMQMADVDRDGDLDAIIPSTTLARLVWYENPLPWGNPKSAWKVSAIGDAGYTHDLEVADLDMDGDVDVVTRQKSGLRTYAWIQQSPSVWTGVVVHTRPGEGVALGDLDGDGDPDLAHNGFWVETPSDPVRGTWTVRTIDGNWPLDVGVHIADVDANGRQDVLLAPSESANGRLSWYASADPRNGSWTEHVIDQGVSYVHTFKTGDMDGDGDLDVVIGEMHQSSQGRVAVYFNHGLAAAWTLQVLATTGTHNLRVGDVGNDGDLDVYGANWNNNSPTGGAIELWENQLDLWKRPSLRLDRWRRHVLDGAKPWQTVFVTSADVDRDGWPDVLTGGHWYRNPGRIAGNWVRREIGAPLHNLAAAVDFDNDRWVDVLGTDGKLDGKGLYWARNDRKGGFTVAGKVADGGGDFLQGVASTGLDVRAVWQVALSWHVSPGGVELLTVPASPAQTPWSLSAISPATQNEALSAGDIDRDGDLDLLLGTKWLRNDGSSFTALTLNPTPAVPDRNRLVDVNGDGRLDAVIGFEANSALERVAWYEQPASPTGIWIEHVVAPIVSPMSLDAGDLDNDGDIDLVAGEHNLVDSYAARAFVFENADGRGLLWRAHLIYHGDEHHDGTQLFDLDRDGDLDVVTIGWRNMQVIVYENLAR